MLCFELKGIHKLGCRCDDLKRLKAKTGGFKSLAHTGWSGGRGDLRTGTRIRGERFESVRGECVI